MHNYQSVSGIFLALLLAGCATMDKSECRQADWQMIGLEDGAKGHPLNYVSNHRKACAEHGVKPNLDRYRDGHASGLRQFCTAQNGFKRGRTGHQFTDVCPAELRDGFLAGYQTGHELYVLRSEIDQMLSDAKSRETELAELEKRIQNVETILVSGALGTADRKTLLDQFKNLQTEKGGLEIEIRNLELGAARRQGEFDVLNSSHNYY